AQLERDKAAAESARLAAEAQVQQSRAIAAQLERDKTAAESAPLAPEGQVHQARAAAQQAGHEPTALRDRTRQQLNQGREWHEPADSSSQYAVGNRPISALSVERCSVLP